MKAINKMNGLKAMAFIVLVITLVSCSPSDKNKEDIKPMPLPPTAVMNKDATNVDFTVATIWASVTPNDEAATIIFEVAQNGTNLVWKPQPLAIDLKGRDVKAAITVTLDLTGLEKATQYLVRAKVTNPAGTYVSNISQFTTVAAKDWDGNVYYPAIINGKKYLSPFRGTHFANGDPIFTSTDLNLLKNSTIPSFTWLYGDVEKGKIYGGLYNHYTAASSKALIEGWHVPTHEEYLSMINYLGGYSTAAPKVMAVSNLWNKPFFTPNNSSGLSVLPGGSLGISKATGLFEFVDEGLNGSFWSSSIFGGGGEVADLDGKSGFFNVGEIFNRSYCFSLMLTQ